MVAVAQSRWARYRALRRRVNFEQTSLARFHPDTVLTLLFDVKQGLRRVGNIREFIIKRKLKDLFAIRGLGAVRGNLPPLGRAARAEAKAARPKRAAVASVPCIIKKESEISDRRKEIEKKED